MTAQPIINSLFSSRQYNPATQTITYSSDVVELVKQVEAAAEAKGLTLSRWQANKSGRKVTITYAIHSGDRAVQARYQPEESVVASCTLDALEGTSKRCEAYRKLNAMLSELSA